MRDIPAERCYYKSKRDVETHLNGVRHRIDKPGTPGMHGMISGARPLSFCPIACPSQFRRRPLEVEAREARLFFLHLETGRQEHGSLKHGNDEEEVQSDFLSYGSVRSFSARTKSKSSTMQHRINIVPAGAIPRSDGG